MTDPTHLAEWQTSKTLVEQLDDAPPGPRTRVRERTKPPRGREFEQIVEFAEFDRPNRLHVHVVQGPQPIDGTWTFEPENQGTRVRFRAEGSLHGAMRLFEPVVKRAIGHAFAGYHAQLRHNLENDRADSSDR